MASAQLKLWIHGLLAAFVSGGAGAISTGITGPMFAPNELNFSGHPFKMAGMMAGTFLVSGVVGACAYLKQSPVPAVAAEEPIVVSSKSAAAGGGN